QREREHAHEQRPVARGLVRLHEVLLPNEHESRAPWYAQLLPDTNKKRTHLPGSPSSPPGAQTCRASYQRLSDRPPHPPNPLPPSWDAATGDRRSRGPPPGGKGAPRPTFIG